MEAGIGVYKAIAAVQSGLAGIGISKDKKNSQQGYNFRGIDDVYDALAPLLAKHGLCFLPRVLSRSCTERQTKTGGTLFYVTVECEFDLVSVEDGSKHVIRTFGEAMDSADKGTNKAMSAAYKYAAFQTFCIPVDAEDADAHTPEPVKPKDKIIKKEEDVPDFIPPNDKPEFINDAQAKRLFAIANKSGWKVDLLKQYLSDEYAIGTSKEIPKGVYEKICTYIESNPYGGKQ